MSDLVSDWRRLIADTIPEVPATDGPAIALGALLPLDREIEGGAARALRYVFAGTDDGILDALKSLRDGAALLKLKIRNVIGLHDSLRPRLYAAPELDAHALVRLGRVFDATSAHQRGPLGMIWAGGLPPWLEILLWEASTFGVQSAYAEPKAFLSRVEVDEALAIAGEPRDRVDALLAQPTADGAKPYPPALALLRKLPHWPLEPGRRHRALRDALAAKSPADRAAAVNAARRENHAPTAHFDLLFDAWCAGPKAVRAAVEKWLVVERESARVLVERRLDDPMPGVRAHAAELLEKLAGEAAHATLSARRSTESDPTVREAIDRLVPTTRAASLASAATAFAPVASSELPAFDAAGTAVLRAGLEDGYARLQKLVTGHASARAPALAAIAAPTDAVARTWLDFLSAPTFSWDEAERLGASSTTDLWMTRVLVDALAPVTTKLGCSTAQVARLMALLRLVHPTGVARNADVSRDYATAWTVQALLAAHKNGSAGRVGLREIATEVDRIGGDSNALVALLVGALTLAGWTVEETWPYFYESPSQLLDALRSDDRGHFKVYGGTSLRTLALSNFAAMPSPPLEASAVLWDLALGTAETDRLLTQRAAERYPDAFTKIVAALTGTKDTREVAAAWLGRLGDRRALAPLQQALAKEKTESGKSALMGALEALGVPVDALIDRAGLTKQAIAAQAKGKPKGLEWFDLDALPAVRWADDGAAVERALVVWWVVQAHKSGDPAPGALLRRCVAQLVTEDAHALGRHVLDAWIAHDTMLPTEDQVQSWIGSHSHYAPPAGSSHYAAYVDSVRNMPMGTAVAHKGLLAIVAATNDPSAGPKVGAYLKRWYGMRAAQCKAMLAMLAWLNQPAAIQLLLATSTRFRTAGIRAVAEECVNELAARRGWTVDELADRTIPAASLDDAGQLELSYGPRRFVAKLDERIELSLFDDAGAAIKGLPAPRVTDDAQAATAAKATLAQSRKELRAIVKQQVERLYASMCTQRTWRASDWREYLLDHPIVVRLCRRLVWQASDENGPARAFRPTEDGTLTTVDHGSLTLHPNAHVRLAHGTTLSEAERIAWSTHLADYEIIAPFDQLGRTPFVLDDARRHATKLDDREGWLLEAFKLRGRATKLGYVRRANDDGAWFSGYRKIVPALGLAIDLEFSGNQLPEENKLVALTALEIVTTEGVRRPLPLGDVPKALLSEAWNDLCAIANEGAYAADWQSRVAQ